MEALRMLVSGNLTYSLVENGTNGTTPSYEMPYVEQEYLDLNEIGLAINKYYMWVILAFGFPGNLATLYVICRMRHLGPFVFYVAILAVTDNLSLSLKILFFQLHAHHVNVGSTGCRLMQFFGCFLMTYCNWILVIMAVERLIAVKYPFRIQFQSCLNGKKIAAILASVGFVIACLYMPLLWAAEYLPMVKTRCVIVDRDLAIVVHWTTMTMYALAPFVILAICNFLIVREIRLSFRLRNAFRSINIFMMKRRGGCDVPIQRQIMFMLFTVTLMFVLLHFPICAFLLVESHWKVQAYTKGLAVKYICYQLAYVMCDSNHALNFYVYFFCGRKFRSHFMQAFSSCTLSRSNKSNSRVNL